LTQFTDIFTSDVTTYEVGSTGCSSLHISLVLEIDGPRMDYLHIYAKIGYWNVATNTLAIGMSLFTISSFYWTE
jgi:hypothetical protein